MSEPIILATAALVAVEELVFFKDVFEAAHVARL